MPKKEYSRYMINDVSTHTGSNNMIEYILEVCPEDENDIMITSDAFAFEDLYCLINYFSVSTVDELMGEVFFAENSRSLEALIEIITFLKNYFTIFSILPSPRSSEYSYPDDWKNIITLSLTSYFSDRVIIGTDPWALRIKHDGSMIPLRVPVDMRQSFFLDFISSQPVLVREYLELLKTTSYFKSGTLELIKPRDVFTDDEFNAICAIFEYVELIRVHKIQRVIVYDKFGDFYSVEEMRQIMNQP